MVTDFNDFINEGIISNFIKKIFNGLIDNIKEDFKKPLEDFTKKVSNTKDAKQMKVIVEDYLKNNYNTLNNTLKTTNTPTGILNTVTDNLKAIYTTILAVNDTIGHFSFDDIFETAPSSVKKLFNKNVKYFNKNVEQFAINLILKFDKNLTKEDLIKSVDETEKGEIQNPDNTKDLTKLKDNIIKWFNYTLYENIKNNLDFEKENKEKKSNIIDQINHNSLKNKIGIKKIVDNIVNINDAKQMAQIRDLLIKLGYNDDYGLF